MFLQLSQPISQLVSDLVHAVEARAAVEAQALRKGDEIARLVHEICLRGKDKDPK